MVFFLSAQALEKITWKKPTSFKKSGAKAPLFIVLVY